VLLTFNCARQTSKPAVPIDQSKLNSETRAAIHIFCRLLPTTIGSVTEAVRDEGLAFTITNPGFEDRSLQVFTDNQELTVCFAGSHWHIADYGQGRIESELIEDMILGIAGILSCKTRSYAVYSGERALGGGFVEGDSEAGIHWGGWSNADRFQIYSWDGCGDKAITQ
jgi:hypothetical protein